MSTAAMRQQFLTPIPDALLVRAASERYGVPETDVTRGMLTMEAAHLLAWALDPPEHLRVLEARTQKGGMA